MIRWVVIVAIVLFVDFYVFQGLKSISKDKSFYFIYWILSIGIYANLIYQLAPFDHSNDYSKSVMLAFGLLILSFAPKVIMFIILFGEDIFRVIKGGINVLFNNNISSGPFLEDRRAFISKIAIGIAAIPFASIIYGMTRGKYNFQVINHSLFFDDLPDTFDGYKITHISDVHSGSFDNSRKIEYGINLINQQNSDVILFTGDIVNSTADEMDAWIPYFKKLKAKDGKYSVLGNHDYGEYARWQSSVEKEQNFQEIKDIHPKIGFNLLLNDSVYLDKGNDKIALIGVENWGVKFKKAGDLQLASSKISENDFKILMSHDPSHWDLEVKTDPKNYHLTLSGHTHGMQFGIEVPGMKWSPMQYIYKNWGGIYSDLGRYINVNRGFGFLAFPGRIGIWPEITVITLKKRNK